MGIQKDAEEVLVYIYKKYVEGLENLKISEIEKVTGWGLPKVTRATKYLSDKKLVELCWFAGETETTLNITSEGIDVIETPKEFKKNFGNKINLGIYSFSWGASEK